MKLLAFTLSGRMLSVRPTPTREVSACCLAPLVGEVCLTAGGVVSRAVWCTMKPLPEPWSLPMNSRLPMGATWPWSECEYSGSLVANRLPWPTSTWLSGLLTSTLCTLNCAPWNT